MMRLFLASTILLLLGIFLSNKVLAQSLPSEIEGTSFHWAYAPAFGTGAYRVGDEENFVITFKPKIKVRSEEKHRIGINVRLPISVGLQTIDPDEFFSQDISGNITTGSFVPGVELNVPLKKRWKLRPYGHIGGGASFSGDQSALIYYTGLDSHYAFEWGPADLSLINGIQWAGYTPNRGDSNWYGRFLFGLEADYPLGKNKFRGQQLLIRPHFLYYWYFNDLDFFRLLESPIQINNEIELALAVGTKKPQKLWLLTMDRIGIGYRFGGNFQGVRIFLQSVFD
jgi:hypothetical protein